MLSRAVWSLVAVGVLCVAASYGIYAISLPAHNRSSRSNNGVAERNLADVAQERTEGMAQDSRDSILQVGHPGMGSSAAPKPGKREAMEVAPQVGIAALAATLEGEYVIDRVPTREARMKEVVVSELFTVAKLEGIGHLQEVSCRQSICRGVISIANETVDNQVFNNTLLSGDFALAVPDAVSVTSREKQPDGTILATFYIHPQSVFDMIPHASPED